MNRSWDIFRNVNEYVRFSDTKAGVVLAFAGGSAAFLSSKVDVFHAVIAAHAADLWGFGLYAAVCCYAVALIATVVFAFRSIWPSLGSGDGRSVIYFKHICEDYKNGRLTMAETARVNKLTSGDELEPWDFHDRETGIRVMARVIAEIALQQRWNFFGILEGAPFQDERALYTSDFSHSMPSNTDFNLYLRLGLTYKF